VPEAKHAAGAVRPPAFAGLFYPDDADRCRQLARQYVAGGLDAKSPPPRRWIGGIVPHAGWVCSGAVAGQTIGTIAAAAGETPDVVVVFGAVHTPARLDRATLDTFARWTVPGDASDVAPALRAKLSEQGGEIFGTDDRFHQREHAVEVELPLIQAAWNARVAASASALGGSPAILPVEVPLIDEAARVGIVTAQRVAAMGLSAVFLASSDLTHYGPAYRFAPAGVGLTGLAWARDNDRRLLDRVEAMDVERIVPVVRDNCNACGGGAIAAMLAACRELGATTATCSGTPTAMRRCWSRAPATNGITRSDTRR